MELYLKIITSSWFFYLFLFLPAILLVPAYLFNRDFNHISHRMSSRDYAVLSSYLSLLACASSILLLAFGGSYFDLVFLSKFSIYLWSSILMLIFICASNAGKYTERNQTTVQYVFLTHIICVLCILLIVFAIVPLATYISNIVKQAELDVITR